MPLSLERVLWTASEPDPGWTSFSMPYVSRDTVVVGTENGELPAMRLADGQTVWKGQVKGRVAGGDRESLYVGTVSGTLYRYAIPR